MRSRLPAPATRVTSSGRPTAQDGSRPLTLNEIGPGGKRDVLVGGDVGASHARLSTGDRWLAYESKRPGSSEVYVQPFPGAGSAVRVSSGGGESPEWAPRTTELFYRRGDELVSMTYSAERGRFTPGSEKTLLRLPSFRLAGVSPDGRR